MMLSLKCCTYPETFNVEVPVPVYCTIMQNVRRGARHASQGRVAVLTARGLASRTGTAGFIFDSGGRLAVFLTGGFEITVSQRERSPGRLGLPKGFQWPFPEWKSESEFGQGAYR
jgi:hypothetical protein